MTSSEIKYYDNINALSVEEEILLYYERVIIPKKLQNKVFEYLQTNHSGFQSMKDLVKFYVWWPYINENIEYWVKKCKECQSNRQRLQETPLIPWDTVKTSLERVHIDFTGIIDNFYLFLTIDPHSQWIEVYPIENCSSQITISCLEDLFSRFGKPRYLVSYNGRQFISHEFKDFCQNYSIKHITSSSYDSRTNGQVEKAIRTIKEK